MGHYYTNDDTLKSDVHFFDFNYKGHTLKFMSDSGVFSKSFIDYGSQVLLKHIVVDSQDKKILDVGCGYGAIGLSLALVYPHVHIDMVDVNLKALNLCKENARCNGIENISVYESNIYENVKDRFDIVLSNPPIRAGKQVVHAILEESYTRLNDGGSLWIVIQKKQGAPSAKKKMTEVFGNCETIAKDKGYYIFQSVKSENF